MQEESFSIVVVAVLGTVIFLSMAFFVVSFLFFFNRKQAQHRAEEASLKARFSQEMLQSQIETQNLTMQAVGQEIHDNIGQILSVAKLNLSILEEITSHQETNKILKQTCDLIDQSITGLRLLSKSLDRDFVQQTGLSKSISHELLRLEKTNRYKTSLNLQGDLYTLGNEREIILFRIVQELLNNSIKHSKGNIIRVVLSYHPQQFTLGYEDNGVGFDYDTIMTREAERSGIGLHNIHRRVKLIGGHCLYTSANGSGVNVLIRLPVSLD
ncbi:hypothetical protein GCM10023187_24140 [Nibrella viscosa]|uniref:histidine kinase n=1 Tax=Nibrella viscosa TaxID=1084524 RepID=A0ABP8KEW4_9BACT